MTYHVGQRVRKVTGYGFEGPISGVNHKLDGTVNYCVELQIGCIADGMQHIFSAAQLEAVEGGDAPFQPTNTVTPAYNDAPGNSPGAEPPGCPTPGACSCHSAPLPEEIAELVRRLRRASPSASFGYIAIHPTLRDDIADALERAYARPAELTAWLYTLHMEFDQKMHRLTLERGQPFGVPGQDYSEEYTVTEMPLYSRPAEEAAEIERRAIERAAEWLEAILEGSQIANDMRRALLAPNQGRRGSA